MTLRRRFRHFFSTRAALRRLFSPEVLAEIEGTIQQIESEHAGEIRFVVESSLDPAELRRKLTPRQRALQVFGILGVWDTAANNGVLIYLLMADRDVEIVADRGIAERVRQEDWESICREMEAHFRAARFREGSIAGIRRVGRLLGQHFPRDSNPRNELPNQPVLL